MCGHSDPRIRANEQAGTGRGDHLVVVEPGHRCERAVGLQVGLARGEHAGSEQRAGHIDSAAGAVALVDREQCGDHRRHRALVVHEAEAVPHRPVALAGAGNLPAARRLKQLVISRPIGSRPLRAVGARVAEDEIGVDLPQRCGVQAQAASGGHAQVVVDDVGPSHKRLEHGARVR